jgi:hypothetical protein
MFYNHFLLLFTEYFGFQEFLELQRQSSLYHSMTSRSILYTQTRFLYTERPL